jgi:hypothetical protein
MVSMKRVCKLLVPLGVSLIMAGCGGSSSTVPVVVYITISPLDASVSLGNTLQFTETTSGSANTAVTWQVNGIEGGNSTYGTISSTGLYTPPATVPNPSRVTVTVISQANTIYLANASVTIVSGVAVSVSPATVNLELAQTQQFNATVTGNSNATVTWFAGGVPGGNATYGTISASGLYTAPASGSTPLAVTVSAVSEVDATKSGSASVIVHGGIQLSLTPNPATVQTFGTIQFVPTISGTTNTGITWQVNGINGGSSTVGTISSTGLYRAPRSVPTQAQNGTSRTATVTVTAVSQADSMVNASASVLIVAPNQSAQALPISLGVSGGNALDLGASSQSPCCGGTLGALVSRGGNFYILGNNHVLARTDQATVGESIIQPALIDTSCATPGTTSVATLAQFANLENPAPGGSVVDAALAQVLSGKVNLSGTVRELGDSTNAGVPTDAPPHAGTGQPPSIGRAVAKSGRSTGLTCSSISAMNLVANVVYQRSCGSEATFTTRLSNLVVIAGGGFSAEGDSGSLIVAQDTADPVALLVASSDSDSIAQPVSDVLSALGDPSTHELPSFVGTADAHQVAACSLGPLQVAVKASSLASPISSEALLAALNVRDARASDLVTSFGLEGVGVGPSLDESGAPAILLFVANGPGTIPLPQTVDGIRTRVVSTAVVPKSPVISTTESAALLESSVPLEDAVSPSSTLLAEAIAAHRNNLDTLLAGQAVQGVGIGASADHPGEAALVIYLIRGEAHGPIPSVIDGVRTRIRETGPFRVGNGRFPRGARCKVSAPVKPTGSARTWIHKED